ncbi:Kelch repeat-containing protein [Ekhidna sp.]|uniref:Kelch repeat-containing protein n=1 Tax=Ekhidna sp. TaxID=2608089 RepID=UPI003CCBA111
MRRILSIIAFGVAITSIAQTPTYKWVGGSNESRGNTNLTLTEPGARMGASAFKDSNGDFWLFGGNGNDFTGYQGYYDDMWKYDRSSGIWEWVSGRMTVDQPIPVDNNSLSFDGINDRIEITNPPMDFSQNLTIEFWFKPTQDGVMLSYSVEEEESDAFKGWRFEIVNSGNEIWVLREQFLIASFSTNANLFGEWHHIAYSYEEGDGLFQGNKQKVYLDGELMFENGDRLLEEPSYDNHVVYVGGYHDSSDDIYFTGELDELRFWNITRSSGEIISNKDVELTGTENGLAAYYKFNQGVANSNGNSETELINETGGTNGYFNNGFYRDGVFIGQMAEVRVWSGYKDLYFISSQANNIVSGLEADLTSAYDFSDGTPEGDNTGVSLISDLTSNSFDGSIENFSLTSNASNFTEDNLEILPQPYPNEWGGRRSKIGDFDDDTFVDIVTINNDHSFSLLLNDQSGGFEAFVKFDLGTFARDIESGYYNDDQFLDVAVVGWDNGTDDRIRIFFGDGNGDFPSFIDLDPGDNTHPESISSDDFNDDGFDDLVIGNRESHQVNVYLADGLGGFGTPQVFEVDWLYATNIALADVNNDGHEDIATGSIYGSNNRGRLNIFLNDGTGNFIDQGTPPSSPYIENLYPIDINQDGNIDFLFRNGNFSGILTGSGDGTFTWGAETNLDRAFGDILPLGFEGENFRYITSSLWQTNFYLYEVTPDAQFTELKQFNTNSSPGNIHLVDFDKDGIDDLVIPEEANRVSVMLLEGNEYMRSDPVNVLDFDGDDDFIEIPDLRPYDGSFTWEAWVKTEDNGPLFSFSSDNLISEFNSGHFSLAIKDKQLTFLVHGGVEIVADGENVITDNNWHHLALAIDINPAGNEIVTLYIDGTPAINEYNLNFDGDIDFSNTNNTSKLGYTSGDFRSVLGTTGQAENSNWTEGVNFPGPVHGRAYNAYWTDANDNFFTFGGKGENGIYNSIKQYDKEADEWITVKGIDSGSATGTYGEKGVSDASNEPPIRWAIDATVDSNGDVWIFGGASNDAANEFYSDLWKYNPISNEWTWISGPSTINELPVYGDGSAHPDNIPGPRSNHKIWTDENDNIWVFGGYGLDSEGAEGYLNDLWKFDTQTLEWTWMDGGNLIDQGGEFGSIDEYNDNNYPGSRSASLLWEDSNGLIWLFGGQGIDKFGIQSGYLNDLWSLNPSTGQWAWHSGSDFAGSTGSYNEPGLSSTDYVPGARWHGVNWIDENDKLWLFGGYKFNQLTTGIYNDFWNYEPSTKEWTWLNGYSSTTNINELGVYGEFNGGSLPFPGSRHGGLTWNDSKGTFWMLGGAELGSSVYGFYNDLWKYEPSKNKWTYILGSTELEINEGVYGSKGIGSSSNIPKSRWHGASWTGTDGKLWFFGGIHHNEEINDIAWLNDLWYFDSESGVYTWAGGSSKVNGSAVYGIKGQSSTGHIPGARSSSAYWQDSDGYFWLFGGYESFEYNNDLWKFNPNTLEWTWVSGNNFQNAPGVYGEKGSPSESNVIGARRYTDGRIDQKGDVWIFGGEAYDSQGQRGWLNDLWKYDASTNTWTWMAGSKVRNTPGVFGTKGVPDPDNLPPPRYGHTMWIDDSGNIWIFGGYGLLGDVESQVVGQLNDLWKFDVKTEEWTWIDGDSEFVPTGVYTNQGFFSNDNKMFGRARVQNFGVYDKSLWFFGGRRGGSISFNDFWEIKFNPALPRLEVPHEVKQNSFSFRYDEPWTREYQIQVSLTDDFSDPLFDIVTANDASTFQGLTSGTYYYYRVNAQNEIGESGFTSGSSLLTLPTTPTFASLETAVSGLTSVEATLNWEVTDGILDGYYLDVSQDPTFSDEALVHEDYSGKSIDISQQQQILALKQGTQYYARIQSFNASGVSPFSQTVPFLTKPETPTFDSEVVVSEITQSSALITWSEVPEILNGYRISVSTLDDGHQDSTAFLANYSSLNIAKTKTSIRLNGLSPGTNYYAYLVAANSSGDSEISEKISIITTPASPVFDLETSILSISQDEITIAWEAPEGFFEGYYLEVSTDPSFVNTNLMLAGYGKGGIPFTLSQDDLSTTVSGLIPGITYHTRIKAFNAAGVSPNSNVLSFTTVPKAPTLGQVNNISQTEATINWQSTPGTDVYLMDINTSEGFEEESALFTDFPLAVPFYVLEELSPGIRYYVRVQSSNASGSSGEMDPADYGQANFITIPGTPNLNNIEYGQNQVTITWPEVTGAASYEVDASDNFFLSFLSDFEAKSITDSEIVIDGLDPGEEYQVRVRAVNEAGESPNAQIVDLLTLPGTPTARDASNSSSRVFTANWDAANGADYYVLEVSLDGFQTFHYNEQLSSASPVKIENLIAGETYEYRVKAGNASGESPYSSSIEVIAQNTAQSLSIASLEYEDEFGENTSSAVISVQFSGGVGDPAVIIRHKEILSPTWSDDIPMTEISPTEFEFTVLSNMLDEVGMVFEIEADDGVTLIQQRNNTIKRTFTESSSEPLPAIELGQWSMISIPYVLEDNLVQSIFNELSDLAYKKRWRLMTYLDGEYQDQGVGFTRIDLGRGYWFNALNDVTISVGAGQTNSTIPFEMALNQGWNQIGNPYNTTINWDEILDENTLTINVGRIITYDPTTKEFSESRTLDPFSGAFVFADQAITLSVSPLAGSTNARTEQYQELEAFSGDNWIKKLSLNWGGKSREIAAVGMHNEASSSKDRFDKPVIPRFENYLEMYTKVDDFFYPKFSHDIKPKSKEHVWVYDLESNHISGLTELTWNPDMLGSGKLWLVDETNGKITEMTSVNSYGFAMNQSHQFSIHYSEDPNYVVIPTRLALGDIYPNPVSKSSHIPLLLPKQNERYDLQLNLYNMNGQLVKTIATGDYAPGIHIFELNAKDIGLRDGMYFYGVTFKNMDYTPKQKKIIIKR